MTRAMVERGTYYILYVVHTICDTSTFWLKRFPLLIALRAILISYRSHEFPKSPKQNSRNVLYFHYLHCFLQIVKKCEAFQTFLPSEEFSKVWNMFPAFPVFLGKKWNFWKKVKVSR